MLKKIIPPLLTMVVLLTACGPEATPTMNPADVQGTAVAAAWTMVAETQLANPTATPLPPSATPSPTPLPTFTALAGATLTFIAPPSPTLASASDPNSCLKPLNVGEAGPRKRVRIENDSGGTVNLSLNLYQINAFGQCGTLQYSNLGKNSKPIVELPVGFWFGYGWVSYKDGTSSTAEGSFEIPKGGDDLFRLIITRDRVNFKGP